MKLPIFSLPANDGKTYSQNDFSKGVFVLYLYPKDMTPGCTLESQDFRDALKEFQNLGVLIFGLSKDSIASHEKFAEKDCLPFPLLSDENAELISALGAWQEKSMYGKKYMGTDRSTFVIRDGEIIREWRQVKVPGHIQAVLDFIKETLINKKKDKNRRNEAGTGNTDKFSKDKETSQNHSESYFCTVSGFWRS